MKAFLEYHPIINFIFFLEVIGCSMFLMHPVTLLISVFCSFLYGICLDGRKSLIFILKFNLPVMFLAAFFNAAFNHEGMTILCYLPGGNPLTLESILYGIAAAVMLSSVLMWFRCYTKIMTTDKFVYLFGRLIPALSLVISMALRFVPKFADQFEMVKESQAGIGKDVSSGKVITRVKNAVKILSIMITWSLENAIETADSMKSRGYGQQKRTAFCVYRMEGRDKIALFWLLLCGTFLLTVVITNGLRWHYFPVMGGNWKDPLTIGFYLAYLCLCLTPVVMDQWEEHLWKSIR